MRDRLSPVQRYFALALGITWCFQMPAALARQGVLDAPVERWLPLGALGIFGPLIAGSWLTHRERGRAGLRELFGRLFTLGGGGRWALAGLLLPGLILSAVLLGMRGLGREGAWHYVPAPAQLVLAVIVSLSEEVGWRGYALPRLEERWGPFAAAGILGVVWGLWHIPMLLAVGIGLSWMPAVLLFFVGGSLFFSRIHRETGGSILAAVLAHLGAHLNNSHASMPGDPLPFLIAMVTYALLGWASMRAFAGVLPAAGRIRSPAC